MYIPQSAYNRPNQKQTQLLHFPLEIMTNLNVRFIKKRQTFLTYTQIDRRSSTGKDFGNPREFKVDALAQSIFRQKHLHRIERSPGHDNRAPFR